MNDYLRITTLGGLKTYYNTSTLDYDELDIIVKAIKIIATEEEFNDFLDEKVK